MREKIHVLLLEDNALDARLVQGMLEHAESAVFAVDHVSNFEEGRRALSLSSTYQIILLDLGLPDSAGLQTLRRVMPLAREASVVILTALEDEELGIAAAREGAYDYLVKGQIDARHLQRVLRYSVERSKLHSELRSEIERRTRIQQALQQSEQHYRLLAETAPMAVVISDHKGLILDANTFALRMFGYTREEFLAHSIEMLLPERLRHSHRKQRAGFGNSPHSRPMGIGTELLARRKDGSEFPVEIGLAPMETSKGSVISSTIIDITDRKKIEAQLRLAQRMEAIGQLSGGVAHDFNNLLAVILGSADTALEKLPPGHPARTNLEVITQAGSSAADLTRQLLAFSRQQMLQPQVIDLVDVIQRTEILLRRLLGDTIRFTTSTHPALGKIKADPGQIEQVLVNLAVNARDAMPRGGILNIAASNVELDDSYKFTHPPAVPGSYVMIAVEDNGSGMDAKTQARIFDPFFTTKGLGKGTGLGLATVYGIVKQSAGFIWVYSELNKGTTFKIYLPRVSQDVVVAPQLAPSDSIPLRGCETILIAEDSESLREMAVEYLRSIGYTILHAASGREALRRAQEFPGAIHLLLTDVVMPEMSGPELAAKVSALRTGLRVIFTSGYTDAAIAQQGVLDPATTFIQKPYRPKALAQKIREVLTRPTPATPNPLPTATPTPVTN